MYLTILTLPLLGGLLGVNRKNGERGGPIISALCMGGAATLSLVGFFEVVLGEAPVIVSLGEWIQLDQYHIEWALVYDSLTVTMLVVVTLVSTLIQVYSIGYMARDPHLPRFFLYLSLFAFFMIVLVTAENLLVLFLGWEGVGLTSYLLINFWYTRIGANYAAIKAFLMNRVGDMGLSLGLILLVSQVDDLSFASIFSMTSYLNGDLLLMGTTCVIVGGVAKSAQLGLSAWLASAMEGPTPVSGLIHSSTMVTAGIYLFMRCSPLLEYSSTGLMIITWLGGLSALLGAACGLLENDIKRIIAYSTVSQLGYMVVAVGLSQHSLALFHLVNHAWFKALLFLAAGSVIHAVADIQDVRRLGGLILLLPKTYAVTLLGSLSLMAFPFMTGFYSKDVLLELALVPRNITSMVAYILTLVAALLTASYSARLIILTFVSKPNWSRSLLEGTPAGVGGVIQDPPLLMSIPLGVLALGSAFMGYLTHELFLGLGSGFSAQVLLTLPNHSALLDPSMSPPCTHGPAWLVKYLALAPLLVFFFSIPLATAPTPPTTPTSPTPTSPQPPVPLYKRVTDMAEGRRLGLVWGSNGLRLDNRHPSPPYHLAQYTSALNYFNVFNYWVVTLATQGSILVTRYIDRGLLELVGPVGLVRLFHYLSYAVELVATGYIPHYAFALVVTIITMLTTLVLY